MSDLPGPHGVDIDALYDALVEMSATAVALRDSLAGETEARQTQVRLLERKQLTAQNAIEEAQAANRKSGRSSRRASAAAAVAVVAAITAVVLGVQLHREINRREEDRTRAAIVTCENGNATRKAIIDEFSAFIDVLAAVSPPATTTEVAEARKRTVDKLRADFAAATPAALLARDCSEQAVTDPTTITSLGSGR